MTLNSEVYIKDCLGTRLIPLIKKHKCATKFWPDLASSHYSQKTLDWYQANKVDIIPKYRNPPNCPEFRPIEKYWGIVKRMVKKTRATIRSQSQMLNIWNICSGKVSEQIVRKMMAGIKTSVQHFIRTGEML
jgi:hypothetical protein